MLRLIFITVIFSCFGTLTFGNLHDFHVRVGLIIKQNETDKWLIVERALKEDLLYKGIEIDIRVLKEIVPVEDSLHYHKAFCSLLKQKVDALISSTSSPYYPVLSSFARAYSIPLISPELPQEISQFSTNFSFGIKPVTSRPMLKLFQLYGWRDIVYLYDHNDGPENLNLIFAVGKHVLNLTLDGILRVGSPSEANQFLRKLDKSSKNKPFHVVLDTQLHTAHEILSLHVNDIHVRKKNFHFLYPNPTIEEMWDFTKSSFGAINVTSFFIQNQLPEAENLIRQTLKNPFGTFDTTLYYYYDAALVLKHAIFETFWRAFFHKRMINLRSASQSTDDWHGNCMDSIPKPRPWGSKLSESIEKNRINGTTGLIKFKNGRRTHYHLNITEVSPQGFKKIAYWTNGNLFPVSSLRKYEPTALPLIQTNGRLKIVTIINPPYMMLKNSENGSSLEGNDRFEGYCKDFLDLLAEEMKFEYDLYIVEDGTYGIYDQSRKMWSGIVRELIKGNADIAVADLTITGERQRVVEFTDPFEMVGFSLVMKNPRFVSKFSHVLFFLSAFTADIWICIIISIIVFCILFHFITKFTGAPDSIEAASGIWGRKHAAIVNVWFAIGSSLFQGTGVYPRSISSRISTGFFWLFTLILSSLFIASITAQILSGRLTDEKNPQLKQLKSLSLESIISESINKGWPEIGLIHPSHSERFIKESSIPTFMKFAKYLENNPGAVVTSKEEGVNRVRKSSGNYFVLLESLNAEYEVRRKPCDIIATHDSINYAAYGLATPLGSSLMSDLNTALHVIQDSGALGELHRKWWIDSSECKNVVILGEDAKTVHVISGLLCLSAIGFIIVMGVFAVQYFRRNQNRESRRQQLSFEDMNLGQTLPTPPPELLAEPPPVLNLPEFDKKTLL